MAQIKNDTFTESSDTALESHTSDSGGGWSGENTTRFDVIASTDEVQDDGTDTAQQWTAGDEGSSATSLYNEVNGKTNVASATFWFGPRILVNQTNDDCYWARVAGDGGVRLYSRVTGSDSQLGSTYTISGFAASTYYSLAVDKQGSTVRALLDGTEIISVTNTDVTAAGEVGFTIRRTAKITSLYADDGTYPAGTTDGAASITATGVLTGAATATANVPASITATGQVDWVGENTATSNAEMSVISSATLTAAGQSQIAGELSITAAAAFDPDTQSSIVTFEGSATASADANIASTSALTASGAAMFSSDAQIDGTGQVDWIGSNIGLNSAEGSFISSATFTASSEADTSSETPATDVMEGGGAGNWSNQKRRRKQRQQKAQKDFIQLISLAMPEILREIQRISVGDKTPH